MMNQIFVIGKNRSGTKWLSNTIANHNDVSCVQRAEAGGILEATNLLSFMPLIFGDLSIDDNCLGFLACFAESNFFKLTGLNERLLYAVRCTSYFRYFEYIMDTYAESRGTGYWLQKVHTALLPTLYDEFPNAKFIIIRRDVTDTVRSAVGLRILNGVPAPKSRGRMLRDVFSYHLHDRGEKRFASRANVLCLNYEELLADKRQVVEEVCSFLQMPFQPDMLVDRWPQNTSFPKEYHKDMLLSSNERQLINFLAKVLAILPWPVWVFLHQVDRRLHSGLQERRFVRRSFDLLKEEHGWIDGR
jgi:hypothetical protein